MNDAEYKRLSDQITAFAEQLGYVKADRDAILTALIRLTDAVKDIDEVSAERRSAEHVIFRIKETTKNDY